MLKWILVWWVIHPGHSQVMHIERGFESKAKCEDYAAQLQAPDGKSIRKHCSME
jgi:hypothetical protein